MKRDFETIDASILDAVSGGKGRILRYHTAQRDDNAAIFGGDRVVRRANFDDNGAISGGERLPQFRCLACRRS